MRVVVVGGLEERESGVVVGGLEVVVEAEVGFSVVELCWSFWEC